MQARRERYPPHAQKKSISVIYRCSRRNTSCSLSDARAQGKISTDARAQDKSLLMSNGHGKRKAIFDIFT